ncbi:hypothetical protein D5S17_00125 [Pseudonocardiaceae bacterium YIM PH 21723]|nr:hypothetical protein D5S17_00125 [Pseudonocardiaceae bacterium YIM PH 21723]
MTTLVLGLLSGCAGFDAMSTVHSELTTAGYRVQGVNQQVTNGRYSLDLQVATADGVVTPEEQKDVVRIVWTRFPNKIDVLRVQVDDRVQVVQRRDMEAQFGPRDRGLDQDAGFVTSFLWIIGGFLVFFVVLLVVIIWLVRARMHRQPQQWGPPGAGPRYEPPPGFPPPNS